MPRRNGADGHGDVAATGRLVFARGCPVSAAPGWLRPTPPRLARGEPTHPPRRTLRPGNALPRTQGPTAGVVELVREEGALIMTLTATDAELERLERVVGTRLARFGQKDGLAAA